jgi:regulatory protein
MAGRRRGRTGRGWDAASPRAPRASRARGTAPAPDPEPPPDPVERAREICLRQLAVRPRTRAELATALRRGGVDDRVAAEVLDRYHEVGMIDDAAFAQAWVTSRHQSKGLARRALGSELRRRGVEPQAVAEALDQLDTDTEAETARALVERKLRTATGTPEAIVRRLVGMLARKGYPAGLAYRVVKEALANDDRTAELADQLDPDALADTTGPE